MHVGRVGDQLSHVCAAETFAWTADNVREGGVAIQDHPVTRYGESAFTHLLDKQAVGVVCVLESLHDRSIAAVHYDGVDLACPNGTQRLLGLSQAFAKAV